MSKRNRPFGFQSIPRAEHYAAGWGRDAASHDSLVQAVP